MHQGAGEQDKCQLAREIVKFMRSRTDETTFETSGLPVRFTGNIKTGGGGENDDRREESWGHPAPWQLNRCAHPSCNQGLTTSLVP